MTSNVSGPLHSRASICATFRILLWLSRLVQSLLESISRERRQRGDLEWCASCWDFIASAPPIWGRGYVMREPSENAASGTVAGQTRQAEVTGLDTGRCPLWVISGHGRGEKRTWRCAQRTDELCHRDDVGTRSGRRSGEASLCPPAKISLFRGARDFIRFGRDAEPPQQARQLVDARRVRRLGLF